MKTNSNCLTIQKLEKRWAQNLFICVGLDSDYNKLPHKTGDIRKDLFEFNKAIIDATHDLVCAYKPNSAFYEAHGVLGWEALKRTSLYIKKNYPEIPVLLDAKRGDIGNSNEGYTDSIFDELQMDGVTVSPYLGEEALEPFLKRKDKLIIVLVKTSNPGAGEFQDLVVGGNNSHAKLYQYVARQVADKWNKLGNLGVVMGATYSKELKEVREIAGQIPFLIPGLGAQGGELEEVIKMGKDDRGWGMIINSSRSVIFASSGLDFAEAAREKVVEYNKIIKQIKAK